MSSVVKTQFLFVLMMLFTAACSEPHEPAVHTEKRSPEVALQERAVDSLFSIELPEDMLLSSTLDDQAILQCSQLSRELFCTVTSFEKDEWSKRLRAEPHFNAANSILENLVEQQCRYQCNRAAEVIKKSNPIELSINGLTARGIACDLREYGTPEPRSYWLGFIEGKHQLFEVKIWTSQSRKVQVEPLANQVIKSFKIL